MKEIFIIIIIVALIISFDIITQNYTNNVVDEISKQLELVKENIQQPNIDAESLKEKIKKIKEDLEKKKVKMAYYIEHDEIEKVESSITSIESYIETQEYNFALNQIENNIFILDHIRDKYQLNLENIF